MIGPFVDFEKNPILGPGKGFYSKGAYNPAVIKDKGVYFMLFRAESLEDSLTGRVGLAQSEDGFNFKPFPDPVIVPGKEFDKFGCEDPRLIKVKDTFYLTYVGNPGRYGVGNICLATSNDLIHWKKHGSILKPQKRWDKGQVKAGAILTEKIEGKYFMYFMGEKKPWQTAIGLAVSHDLFHWQEILDEPVVCPRKGYFDEKGVEPGPPPVLISDGILLIYAGWGENHIYKVGATVFSKSSPWKVIKRSDKPILSSIRDWGAFFGGVSNHIVPEGLVLEEGRWLLYYGAADRACCVALWEVKK
ncbi:family 43 glycosylhydrolase [Candidatus Aerophobetes bacterium]|nr:family 43 glycosylhydrolase [Candidatus Aerophobetes bacterium]